MFCVNCGKPYGAAHKFCNYCGHPLPGSVDQKEEEFTADQLTAAMPATVSGDAGTVPIVKGPSLGAPTSLAPDNAPYAVFVSFALGS